MSVSQSKDKYLQHLQKLVAHWDNLSKANSLENKKYQELYQRSKTILDQLCHDSTAFLEEVRPPSSDNIDKFIGKLRATLLDLQDGFLHIEYQIQDKVTVDLMQQAQELLNEGGKETYGHIPAAVLAGAVLENFLRMLCVRHSPPIVVTNGNGTNKTLGMLVGELEKAGFFDVVDSKQIKVWVEIRNQAAHGQFENLKPERVKDMIGWISKFIEDHQIKG